jgi:erythromycin esterase-like protein
MNPRNDAIVAVRQAAQPLTGAHDDYDGLLELIADARFVLIGEATHGTHDFYRERAQIANRLVCDFVSRLGQPKAPIIYWSL